MAHIDEGTLQAYLDDEVGARAEIDAHLSACQSCAAELNRLRGAAQLFTSVVGTSDIKAPTLAAFAAVGSARGVAAANPRRAVFHRPLARAAMFVVGFAALASAAIPGSPVRAWISSALRSVGVMPDEVADAPAVTIGTPNAATPTDAAALAIEPADGRVRIILTNVDAATQVRVRMTESDRALVQATGDAAKARFRTGAGRIELIGVGKGEVLIDLPNSVKDARVEADGRVLFEKRH
jgi:hypothetical protein